MPDDFYWLASLDDWKTATPPEYEARDTCPSCGEQEGFSGGGCAACGWDAEDAEDDAYWRHWDMKIDAARGK